jgi:hypothetical protein
MGSNRASALTRPQVPAQYNRAMESHPAGLFRDALALPPEARSAPIDTLIESLDEDRRRSCGRSVEAGDRTSAEAN